MRARTGVIFVCIVLAGMALLLWPRAERKASPTQSVDVVKQPAEFGLWAETYRQAATPAARASLEPVGVQLARARRQRLAELIETDPQAALEQAVPYRVRRELPAEVQALLEERVSATGFFGVLGTFPGDDEKPIHRHFDTGQQTYRAFVYGRRLAQQTTESATLHGIAIDSKLAVAEDPVRVLEPEEAADRRAEGQHTCPVSGAASESRGDEQAVEVAGQVVYLCSGGHIAALNGEILSREAGSSLVAQSAWTTGTKTMLVINIRFSDQASCPDTGSGLTNMMTAVNLFFITNSFNQTDMISTVTPCYQLPETVQWYTTNDTSGYFLNVLQAARAVAVNPTSYPGNDGLPAYNYLNYNLEAARYSGPGGFSGQAYVGSRGCWLKTSSAGVADHEFGHNYGVWHANYWNCTNDTVTGAGIHVEYGNSFDTMGAAGGGAQHFNSNFKRQLDWITDADLYILNTASTGGTFRITALDHGGSKVAGAKYAIRIPSATAQRDYWIDFRQLFPANKWLTSGAVLKWGNLPANDGGSRLLDTTPGTADDKNDSAIVIGRTYSDFSRNTHITPIAKAGTSPEALDVVVNIGTFAGNLPPTLSLAASATNVATSANVTFTASASDPNGDTLAYYWDFGDRNFGSNTTVVTKNWSAAGYYTVRCTASDMKGGSASSIALVKVGTPTTFNVSGVVRDQNDNPLADVRVHNGLATSASNYRTTYTASDGSYILAGMPSGSYTVTAIKSGYALAAEFANPLSVTSDRADINFNAGQSFFTISGQVTDSGVGVAGALVSDGTRTEPTDSAGNYTLYNVPNGSYTLTATKTNSTFSPSGFTNPVTVDNASLASRNFTASTTTYSISGKITGVTSTTPVTITDGYRSTTSAKQGNNNVYTLSGIPAGTWNLRAYTATQSFTPSGFTNPVAVTGALNNRDFALDASQTFAISGTISNALGGVAGVTVGSSASDTRGGYYLDHLTNGTYTVTPTLAGAIFTPASRTVTITSGNSSNQNFLASINDPPPTIAAPAAAVMSSKTAVLSVLGADNNGEAYLRYTWNTTGTPPASVTFSINNANAAKNCTATITKAGNYGLRAVVNDVSGGTATSIVSAVVSQTVTAVSISPSNATINAGTTQQFTGNSIDQFGDGFVATLNWSVSGGGTISTSGLFTAGITPGSFTVTGHSGGKTGTATVVVNVPTGTGTGITREFFGSITGTAVSNLTNDAKFINNQPDSVSTLTNLFESPSNAGNSFGERVRGFFVAPLTGNHVFLIASEKDSELWLSTDTNPSNRVKIASVSGATNSREWTKYASQTSSNIPLVAGQRYYIEALHKEGTGTDNLAVGVDLPGGFQERPIPAHRLEPWSTNSVPNTVAITTPTNGASFFAPTNILITATSDATSVSFYAGVNLIGAVTNAPFTMIWSNVTAGSYALTARAGVTTSTVVNVAVTLWGVEDWRQQQFGINAGNPTIAGDDADPDGDGLSNLLEYALGLDPNISNTNGPTMALESDHLTLTYTRRKAPTDVSYVVLVCGDMPGAWSSAGITEEILADNGLFETVKAIDPATITGNTGRFIRLKVTRP